MMKLIQTTIIICLCMLTQACHRTSRLEQIAEEARLFTQKQCPFNVDPYTRMDSTTFDPSSLCYYYNYTVSDLLDNDSIYTEELCERFRQQTLDEIRSSIQLKGYKEAGLTLVYRYYSASSGRMIAEFEFPKEDYAN